MHSLRGVYGEITTIWQAADRATGPWVVLTAAWTAIMSLLQAHSTGIIALFGLLLLDTVVGAWAYYRTDRVNFSLKKLFGRAFEKMAAMILICAAALLFSLVAPDAQTLALGGVLTAFALKETASVIYNVHRVRPALVPRQVFDWVRKLYKTKPDDAASDSTRPDA